MSTAVRSTGEGCSSRNIHTQASAKSIGVVKPDGPPTLVSNYENTLIPVAMAMISEVTIMGDPRTRARPLQ